MAKTAMLSYAVATLVVNPLRFQRQVGWINAQLVVAQV